MDFITVHLQHRQVHEIISDSLSFLHSDTIQAHTLSGYFQT